MRCQFLRKRLSFLGHVVDSSGIRTADDKIAAVKNFPTPASCADVRSFLGISGYYRRFVRDFSRKASPLTRLLRKDVPFEWGPEQENAFQELKTALITAPILSFPNYQQGFTLFTDASGVGVGAVLCQQDAKGFYRPLAFASRVLNDAETRYSVTHLEALAVVWALRHFKDIIYGYEVVIYTDHKALLDLFKGRNLSGRLARWFLIIQEYRPELRYLPGRANVVADALSRHVPVAAAIADKVLATFTPQVVREAQRQDPKWLNVILALESGDPLVGSVPGSLSDYDLIDGILCRHHCSLTQVVVPLQLVPDVLVLEHDSPQAGHPGVERCLTQARRRYYWPTMRADIRSHIQQCLSCATHKGTTGPRAPMLSYPTPAKPWDTVGLDTLELPFSSNGMKYLLVAVDHFSRYVILVPLPDKSAFSVARTLVRNLFHPFTTPKVLLSDNGTEFRNALVSEICTQFNVTQTFVAVHHPASNGLVERANRKVLEVLRHVVCGCYPSWDEWIPQVASSINSSVNASIGESPHFVVFGEDKRLPFHLLTDRPSPVYNVDDYAKVHLAASQRIFDKVRTTLDASRDLMVSKQHEKARPSNIEAGDLVFLAEPERVSKLAPRFTGPLRVLCKEAGNKVKTRHLWSGVERVVHVDNCKRVHPDFPVPPEEAPQPGPAPASSPSTATPHPSSGVDDYRSKLRSSTRRT